METAGIINFDLNDQSRSLMDFHILRIFSDGFIVRVPDADTKSLLEGRVAACRPDLNITVQVG